MTFIDNLVKRGVIKESESEEIIAEADESGDLDKILEEHGVDPILTMQIRSEYFGIPTRDISDIDVPFDILKNVPEESATYYKFVPIGVEDGVLSVGIVDPDNIDARDAVQFIASKLGLPFKLFIISLADLKLVIGQYKGITGEVNKALSELETELGSSKNKKSSGNLHGVSHGRIEELSKDPSKTQIIEEAPVTKKTRAVSTSDL